MPLVRDVVEIWQLCRQQVLVLSLLEHVLLLVPQPLWVDFSKVFNYQAVFLNALFSLAEDP